MAKLLWPEVTMALLWHLVKQPLTKATHLKQLASEELLSRLHPFAEAGVLSDDPTSQLLPLELA